MKTSKRILAVASGGGHWVQLLRLRRAFDGCNVVYVSTNPDYKQSLNGEKLYTVTDASMWEKLKLVKMLFEMLFVMIRVRPDVILSTGAAPGFAAILIGKLFGAKTIWIDSIANSEELSNSGKKIGKLADLWLTQWPHLAKEGGPSYWGSIL
jgi:UDP-N-acetylglucosamine:LPS N-acetylglucosamine transferase